MEQHFELLKGFVMGLQQNPDMLHEPKLKFFADYLVSLGATLPPKKEKKCPMSEPEKPKPEPETTQAASEEEEEPEIPYPELDNSGVIESDDSVPLSMGDENKSPSDDDMEKASELRDAAMAAFSEGNLDEAVQKFTAAIELNPQSAVLYAKRANALLKLKKPTAAIADCDRAVLLNPDSAQAFKFRGRAYRLLGKWLEAHKDLATACKIDFDDTANEWLKEVEPNAKKLQEYNRALDRRELKEKVKRSQKIREANRKAAEEAAQNEDFDFGMPGGAGGMPADFQEVLKDPELMNALNDIMSNPGNISKYAGNPKIMKFCSQMFGAGGSGMFGNMGGMFGGGCSSENCSDSACGGPADPAPEPAASNASNASSGPTFTKVPEPDLD